MPKAAGTRIAATDQDGVMATIESKYGAGTVMRLGDNFKADVVSVSTGIPSLDIALGIGGLPLGRIIEAYGPESGGKTTLALSVVGEAQRAGLECAYIDAEHALDPIYAKAVGVSVGDLWFSQPDTGEQALEIVSDLCSPGAGIKVIVIDSVAALTPRAEIEGEMGDAHVGLQARMMSQGMRKLNGVAYRNGVMLFFINQIREKIGVMYGSPEVTPGGRALKFYSSVRLDVRRVETVKEGGDSVANKTRVKVVKNKVAPPYKQAEFEIEFGHGVDKTKDLINVAVDAGVVKKSGAWYTYEGEQLGQGLANSKTFLEENPNTLVEIRTKTMEAVSA